ncbi:MAG TPA: hypothetical protein VK021_06290 [Flavobacteriaceae bacterium]|nr:hypothetical protein [Flavobacteriaceae bacterium]
MKRFINLTILLLVLLIGVPTQAQFWKKLNKKVQDAAEDKVLDKSAKKTSKSVDEGMDDIFSIGKDNGKKKFKKNKTKSSVSPQNSYFFSHLYVTSVETSEESDEFKIDLEMFLTKSGEYMGMRGSQGEAQMFTVMDYSKATAFNFMSTPGGKMMFPVSIDIDDDEEDDFDNSADFKITSLPNKTFLGYKCKGKKLEDDEWEITLYYTDQVPVSMNSIFNDQNEEVTNMFQKEAMDISNGLVMYMKGKNKRNKDENYIMKAKKLEKVDYNFSTSGYQQVSGGMFE